MAAETQGEVHIPLPGEHKQRVSDCVPFFFCGVVHWYLRLGLVVPCGIVVTSGFDVVNNVATEKCGKGVLAAAGATRPLGKEVEWDGAEQGGFMCVRFDKLTN